MRFCWRSTCRWLPAACLWLLTVAAASAQRYPIIPVPGSPHGIFTMMQDSRSAIWMGTIDDVYCFDGERFYSLRQYGFPRETPNAFAEDSEGGIWIGTQGTDIAAGSHSGSLYRYRAGRVEKVLNGDVLSIVSAGSGLMLAAMGREATGKPSFGDLYRIARNRDRSSSAWTHEKIAVDLADHMTVDHGGNILFPCPGGWCEVASSLVAAWPKVKFSAERHPGDPLSERVLRDRFGCVWYRAEIHGGYQCPGDVKPTQIPFPTSQDDASAHLEEGPDGSVFMLVPLLLGRPGSFRVMPQIPSGLETALLARDGTIWLGTESGLYRVMYPFHMELWGPQEGLTGTLSLARRIGGTLIAASNNVLMRFASDQQRWLAMTITGLDPPIRDIVETRDHRILVTAREEIAAFGLDGKRVASALPGTKSGYRFAKSSDGRIWMAADGISEVTIRGSRISLHPEPVPDHPIAAMRYDAARDTLWACDGRELLFRKNGVWSAITQKDGLLDADCIAIGIVSDGDVWMGYAANAYAVIHDPAGPRRSIHNITHNLDAVTSDSLSNFIGTDRRGWVWRATDALAVANEADGENDEWLRVLPESEAGRPQVPTDFFEDTDGTIWFVSESGLTHLLPPEGFASRFPSPPVFVSGIAAGTAPVAMSDTVQRIPRDQEVNVALGSLQFDRRSALRVRYQLLPGRGGWQTANEMNLHLGRLRWGEHTLQVQARLATGPWSPVVEQSFTVMRPVWLTWPALTGFAGGGGLLLAGGLRWRKKRRKRARRAFPELAALRLATFSPELQQIDSQLLDDRYEVGHILARGGFATVLRGRDRLQGNLPCAIKVFRQELMDKEWMERRFRQEVLALETIHHPNVVRIYGHGMVPDRGLGPALYLVMELIDGTTLREELDHGPVLPQKTASYLRQTGSALDEMHARGVCHRDLKPENLMIRRAGIPGEELVLIDFSIALVKDPDQTVHGLSRAAGTISYMAPEQVIGFASSSTDIYSLARIVIEMLTGQRLSALLPDASMDLPDRVRELLTGSPFMLSTASIELIGSALEFDPARRPKLAGDFAERIAQDLEAVAQPA